MKAVVALATVALVAGEVAAAKRDRLEVDFVVLAGERPAHLCVISERGSRGHTTELDELEGFQGVWAGVSLEAPDARLSDAGVPDASVISRAWECRRRSDHEVGACFRIAADAGVGP